MQFFFYMYFFVQNKGIYVAIENKFQTTIVFTILIIKLIKFNLSYVIVRLSIVYCENIKIR